MGNSIYSFVRWQYLKYNQISTDAMNPQIRTYKIKDIFTRPWVVETLFFFLIAWQESIRLSLRTSGIGFSPRWLKDFYFYNFGDFVNGYIMAYIFDGLTNYFIFQKKEVNCYSIFQVKFTKAKSAILACVISAIIIIIFEIGQSSALTTADLMDIPAGVGGAIFYCWVRLLILHMTKNK